MIDSVAVFGLPGFDTVTLWVELVVPADWLPKASKLGATEKPIPLRLTGLMVAAGGPGYVPETATELVNAPAAVGLNVTLMLQLLLPATGILVLQEPPARENGAGTLMLVNVNAAASVFVSVSN